MILGTAGHIDHGKTALVRALTGVDTDRLPEEKRRGITIDLGFAPLPLGNGVTIGVVDVPGHEAFVRTMLAGASGIDLALLVVAADEGVMPQTREHVAILSLLGVRAGVVALTKSDLVEPEWLALVADDVRQLLNGTGLDNAPVHAVSVVTGAGLDELRAAIAAASVTVPPKYAEDLFRLPVDRAFTMKGSGTVVTGTVWSGSVGRDDVVRIMPGGREARVRGVQSHGADVPRASAGLRAAIALAGVELDAAARGTTLVAGPGWEPTRVLRAEVTLVAGAQAPRPRTAVRFHLGTADVGGRLVAAPGSLTGGARTACRIVLDQPVAARGGDRFVLRSASPLATIGGGVVTDPLPAHRRAKRWAPGPDDVARRLELMLREADAGGIHGDAMPVRLGLTPDDATRTAAALTVAQVIGQHWFHRDVVEHVRAQLLSRVEQYHREHPLEEGASLQALRAQSSGSEALFDSALADLARLGSVVVEGGVVRRTGWGRTLTVAQRTSSGTLVNALSQAGREPPNVAELTTLAGPDVPALLRLLEREGTIVQVESDRYYSRVAIDDAIVTVSSRLVPGRVYPPGELREVLGVSRKYLIPLLEYLDRRGVTERRGEGRALRGT